MIESDIGVAIICVDCGKINVKQINLFKLQKKKEIILSCSCGSLNCIINSTIMKNTRTISLEADCVDCGETHFYGYKLKEFIYGADVYCPVSSDSIATIGDRKDISAFIKNSDKKTLDMLFDEKFDMFFDNHYIMKESLLKLQSLKENSNINCKCGNEFISTELYSDRIELRCAECESKRIIYAENQDDLKNFYEKNSIDMNQTR